MADKLTKMLEGKYVAHKINARYSVDQYLINSANIDIEKHIKQGLKHAIVDVVTDKHIMIRKHAPMPDRIGITYEAICYAFNQDQFEQLVDDIFNAGVVAASAKTDE